MSLFCPVRVLPYNFHLASAVVDKTDGSRSNNLVITERAHWYGRLNESLVRNIPTIPPASCWLAPHTARSSDSWERLFEIRAGEDRTGSIQTTQHTECDNSQRRRKLFERGMNEIVCAACTIFSPFLSLPFRSLYYTGRIFLFLFNFLQVYGRARLFYLYGYLMWTLLGAPAGVNLLLLPYQHGSTYPSTNLINKTRGYYTLLPPPQKKSFMRTSLSLPSNSKEIPKEKELREVKRRRPQGYLWIQHVNEPKKT